MSADASVRTGGPVRVARPGVALAQEKVADPAQRPCIAPAQAVQPPCTGDATAVHAPCNIPSRDTATDVAAWQRASEDDRERARARLRVVRRAEALVADGCGQGEANATAATEAGVSVSSVAGWRRRVRGLSPETRVRALLEGARSGRPSIVAGNVAWQETLEALVWHGGPHLTANHAQRTLLARYGDAPSLRTIRSWLARWRRRHARSLSAVSYPDAHRSRRQPAFGDATGADWLLADGLNALWELDSTIADLHCAEGRRRALIVAVDVWSRRCRCLVTETSRATAVAALLRRCILDWGVPAAVRTDEGADYTSVHLRGVLEDLGIAHVLCPPYTPEAKPFVERLIGTVSRDLFAHLPGFAGHSPADAARLRARKSFAGRRGEAPSVTLGASLSPDDLQDRLDGWADALYGHRPHTGLDGVSPFARAASWTGPVRRISDVRALDALMSPPAKGGERVVGKKGISVDGGLHIAAELGPLVGERVGVRLDATDAGRIHVYAMSGAFICIAEDPLRTGLDRWATAIDARTRAREADGEARARAREVIGRHRPEQAMDDVLGTSVRDAGCVVALPRAAEAHETPALTAAAHAARAAAGQGGNKSNRSNAPAGSGRVIAAARQLYLEEDQ